MNLPRTDKLAVPRYQDLASDQVALLTSRDGGALVRVIAGEVAGHTGPGSTHTPMTMIHATISPGRELELPWRTDFNALVYVMSGTGQVGPKGTSIGAGQLAVLGHGRRAARLPPRPARTRSHAGRARGGHPRRPADP